MDEIKLKKLEAIMAAMDIDTPSTQEVADLVATIISFVREAKEHLESQAIENKKELNNLVNRLTEQEVQKIGEALDNLEKKAEKVIKSINEKTQIDLDLITKNLYLELKKLEDSIPQKADFTEIYGKIKEVESKIVPFILKAEEVRDSLETLKENERLDISAIKGVEKLEEKIKSIELRPSGIGGGARGFQLYVDGTKRGQVSMANFIAGTNVTLTYAAAFGRNDITISATGGGSLSVLTVTGTVDDTNTAFSVATEPTLVIVNGAAYRSTGDSYTWTWVATVLTMSQAIGSGGSIYALG